MSTAIRTSDAESRQSTEAPPSSKRIRRSFVSDAFSLSASQVTRRLFRMLFLLLAARWLGPEVFGLYVLLLTIADILTLLSGAGYGDYLTREVARSPKSSRKLLFKVIQLHFTYRLVLSIAAILALASLKYPADTVVDAAVLSLTLFPRGIVESSQGIMRGLNNLQPLLSVEMLQGAALIIIGVLLSLRGHTLRNFVCAEFGSALFGASIALPLALRLCVGDETNFTLKSLMRKTVAFNLYPLLTNTYDRADVLILSRLAGNSAVGIYAVPYRLYAALAILPYGIMGTLLPSLSKSDWNQSERKRCRTLMEFLYAAALLLLLGIMLFAQRFVPAILGPGYERSGIVLMVLGWATLPMFLNYALNTFLLAKNSEKVFLRTTAVCTVTNVASNILLIPRYSYIAASGVTILTELVLLVQNTLLCRKTLGFVPMPSHAMRNSFVFLGLLFFSYAVFQEAILPRVAVWLGFSVYLHLTRSLPWSIKAYDRGLQEANT